MGDQLAPALTTGPRNVLHINFVPNNLGFIGSWISKRARLIQLTELGSAASIKIKLPGGTPTSVFLPAAASYMQWSLACGVRSLPIVFGSSLEPRMAIVQGGISASVFSNVFRRYLPDIVMVDSGVELTERWYEEQQLVPVFDMTTEAGLKAWGLPGLQCFANEIGRRSLHHTLAMFGGYYRQRRKEATRVYDVGELFLCEGFYPVESENGNQWAWTGSETVATLLIPCHGSGRLRITLFMFGSKISLGHENIDVRVDGDACACAYFLNEKIEIATGYLRSGCSHRVDIVQGRTIPTSDGSRQIGLALHKVKVERVL